MATPLLPPSAFSSQPSEVWVRFEPGEALKALLIVKAFVLAREGNEEDVVEDVYGALVALEEALGMGKKGVDEQAEVDDT